jgi:hypothetical protein
MPENILIWSAGLFFVQGSRSGHRRRWGQRQSPAEDNKVRVCLLCDFSFPLRPHCNRPRPLQLITPRPHGTAATPSASGRDIQGVCVRPAPDWYLGLVLYMYCMYCIQFLNKYRLRLHTTMLLEQRGAGKAGSGPCGVGPA